MIYRDFLIRIVCMILIGLMLTGCEHARHVKRKYWKTSELAYMESALIEPLQVPPDLTYDKDNHTYPIPHEIPPPESLSPVSLVPPGFGELTTDNT